MTTYRVPEGYTQKFSLLRKSDYLFSGFNYNIHFWKISGFPLGSNRNCSMGYSLENNDVVCTWEIAPYVFCMIKMERLEDFLTAAQEAMTKEKPTAITRCEDITFVNTKNQSIYSIGSPSIEIKGNRLRAFGDKDKKGFTDRTEIQELINWFNQSEIRTEITSAVL